jgi:hypothetical protein
MDCTLAKALLGRITPSMTMTEPLMAFRVVVELTMLRWPPVHEVTWLLPPQCLGLQGDRCSSSSSSSSRELR